MTSVNTTNAAFFSVRIKKFGGSMSLEKTDIKLGQGGELPNEKATKLGSKQGISPAHLAPLQEITAAVDKILQAHAFKVLDNHMVLVEDAKKINDDLLSLKARFDDYVDNVLCPNAIKWQREWREQFPELEANLAANERSPSYIKARCRFTIRCVDIRPSSVVGAVQADTTEKNTGEDLLESFSKEAEVLLRYITTHGVRSRRIMHSFEPLRDKLSKFERFNPAMITPVVNRITAIIDKIDQAKAMDDGLRAEVTETVMVLADPDKLREYGNMVSQVTVNSTGADEVSSPTDLFQAAGPEPVKQQNPMAVVELSLPIGPKPVPEVEVDVPAAVIAYTSLASVRPQQRRIGF